MRYKPLRLGNKSREEFRALFIAKSKNRVQRYEIKSENENIFLFKKSELHHRHQRWNHLKWTAVNELKAVNSEADSIRKQLTPKVAILKRVMDYRMDYGVPDKWY